MRRLADDVLQGYVADMAKFVLMQYECAYDPTCAASSEYRWVAPLNDRKELKPSNVLAATYFTWNQIYFEIDQCDSKTQPIPSGVR